MFENRAFSESDVILKYITEAKEWQFAQSLCRKEHISEEQVQPLQASPSSMSCFIDAAWQASTRNCGLGILFKSVDDHETEHQTNRQNVTSALAGEAWAMREALLQALDRDLVDLMVLSDSLSLVNLINYHETHTKIHAIVNDIRLLALSFSSISFRFIPRSANAMADLLAKQALQALLTL